VIGADDESELLHLALSAHHLIPIRYGRLGTRFPRGRRMPSIFRPNTFPSDLRVRDKWSLPFLVTPPVVEEGVMRFDFLGIIGANPVLIGGLTILDSEVPAPVRGVLTFVCRGLYPVQVYGAVSLDPLGLDQS
jgi:hypothetical protein